MKTIFYITGTSRGIGLRLAELALQEEHSFVYGIARRQAITHAQYQHVAMDLSDLDALSSLNLPVAKDAERVVLVNNAGMLGAVAPMGQLDNASIISTHTLNAIAPTILSNWIIHNYSSRVQQIVILNVSSGVANYPLYGWANYCASKASLNMLTRVIALENGQDNVKVFAVAPGIVDTDMQKEIRGSNPVAFPNLPQFNRYKEEGLLSNPAAVAKGLMQIINSPDTYGEELLDLRKL